jgi:hypothetical protein
MTRFALFAAAVAGVLSASASRADVEVAPPPREVRPDGSRASAPAPEKAAKPANPAETVARIIKNSKAVGDRLAKTDTGAETRGTQSTILKDIDSLLDQENPPPKGGGGSDNKNDQKNPDQSKDKKPNDQDPSGGMKDAPPDKSDGSPQPKGGKNPMGGTDPKTGQQPMGGDNQANTGRRPRAGTGKVDRKPDDPGKDREPGMANTTGAQDKKEPVPGGAKASAPKDPKDGKGGVAGVGPKGTANPRPSLPLDDEVVKEVWGHLPDKLRQQVTQYYKEQFMPRYADLLKQYYSSLANTPQRSPAEMRK